MKVKSDKRVSYSVSSHANFINWGHVAGGCVTNDRFDDLDDCIVDSKHSIEGSSGFNRFN